MDAWTCKNSRAHEPHTGTVEGREWQCDGQRQRAPRPTVNYQIDYDDPAALIKVGLESLALIAHIGSDIMLDHLEDGLLVRDVHDINGSIGHLQSVLRLLERRI